MVRLSGREVSGGGCELLALIQYIVYDIKALLGAGDGSLAG